MNKVCWETELSHTQRGLWYRVVKFVPSVLRMETFSTHARDQVYSLSDCEDAIVIIKDKLGRFSLGVPENR